MGGGGVQTRKGPWLVNLLLGHSSHCLFHPTLFMAFVDLRKAYEVSRVARSMKFPGKVSAFMDQEPRKGAGFLSECLDYRRFEAPDLHPYVVAIEARDSGVMEKLLGQPGAKPLKEQGVWTATQLNEYYGKGLLADFG